MRLFLRFAAAREDLESDIKKLQARKAEEEEKKRKEAKAIQKQKDMVANQLIEDAVSAILEYLEYIHEFEDDDAEQLGAWFSDVFKQMGRDWKRATELAKDPRVKKEFDRFKVWLGY